MNVFDRLWCSVAPPDLAGDPGLGGGGTGGRSAGHLDVSPTSINFGSVPNNSSTTTSWTATNTGSDIASVTSITVTNVVGSIVINTYFPPGGPDPAYHVNPGDQLSSLISAVGQLVNGAFSCQLNIIGDFDNSPIAIPLSGNVVSPAALILQIDPTGWNYGDVKITIQSPEKLFTLKNIGGAAFNITALLPPTDFITSTTPVLPIMLNPGDSTQWGIKFQPSLNQLYVDQVASVSGTFTGGAQDIILTGNGVLIVPAYTVNGATWAIVEAANSGLGAIVLARFDPADLNCEEDAFFDKTHDFETEQREKEVTRIYFRNEDLGVASLAWTTTDQRGQASTKTVPIGTVGTTGKVEAHYADLETTGEFVTFHCDRPANGGPVSLTAYSPKIEPKGEFIP